MLESLATWWANTSSTEILWLAVGFGAQLMFSMRFLIQWIASEKARASIVPETFWYFSFVGGAMLLVYAIYRVDPVFIMGQATGLLIYSRNIYFIWKNKETP
ncbi:MAG: lipid-A-disaccharide synthase N-terminal domain-containing protein [Rhizobiaceae bacterium]|nr:lipid-A-disaccharide synthase N-terminal domain-containing protein [Rhizobiaceae bacterium]